MKKVNLIISDGDTLQDLLTKITTYMGLPHDVSFEDIVFQRDSDITISYEKKVK